MGRAAVGALRYDPYRPFVRGGNQVQLEDVGVGRVDHCLLEGTVEHEPRRRHEGLLHGIVGRDEDGDRVPPAAAGPSRLLRERGGRARVAEVDRRVQAAHIHPQLERRGGNHTVQLAAKEPPLDVPPLLERVARAVARQPRPQRRGQPIARRLKEPLRDGARAHEGDGAKPVLEHRREQVCGLVHRRSAPSRRARSKLLVPLDESRRLDPRRVPQRQRAPSRRRGVGRDHGERARRQAGEPRHVLSRVGDGGGAADEARARAIPRTDAAQAAEDEGDVRAEDAVVRVRLVDDNELEVCEEGLPLGVMAGEERGVEQVRVAQEHVAPLGQLGAVRPRRVAIERRGV